MNVFLFAVFDAIKIEFPGVIVSSLMRSIHTFLYVLLVSFDNHWTQIVLLKFVTIEWML